MAENSPPEGYGGVDTLEVMLHARNYNDFLLREVKSAGRGAREVLDFGAGLGNFAEGMREAGFHVRCVETDEKLSAALRSKGFEVYPDITAVPEGSVDYVYSLNVLEHIGDDGAALAAVFSRLRDGGRLFLYVPAFQVLYSAMDRKVGHFRRYRRAGLVRLLLEAGFTVRRAAYVDSLGFFLALLYSAAGDREGNISESSIRFFDSIVFPASRVLDRVFGPFLGKNLLVVAEKPSP